MLWWFCLCEFSDLGAEDISAKQGIFFLVFTSTKLILMAGALFQY